MPTYDPLEVFSREQLEQRTSYKWVNREGALPFFIAEMDCEIAEPIRTALHEAIDTGDTGYEPDATRFARAYRQFAKEHWGQDVDVTRVCGAADVMTGMRELLTRITDPGDPVIITPPVYPPFYKWPRYAGREVVEAPLGDDGRLCFDTLEETFRAAHERGGRAVCWISNPHNPTGVVHSREELTRLAELAERYGVVVVSDEIHSPLVYDGEHTVYTTVDPRGYVVFSASKAFNLAGLRAALIIGGTETGDVLDEMAWVIGASCNHLGVIAQEAALLHGGEWLASLLPALKERRDLVTRLVEERLPGVSVVPGDSTYLAWLDFSKTGLPRESDRDSGGDVDPEGLAARITRDAGVKLNAGEPFGCGGRACLRFNYATRKDLIEEAIDRMAALLVD